MEVSQGLGTGPCKSVAMPRSGCPGLTASDEPGFVRLQMTSVVCACLVPQSGSETRQDFRVGFWLRLASSLRRSRIMGLQAAKPFFPVCRKQPAARWRDGAGVATPVRQASSGCCLLPCLADGRACQ